MAAQPDLVAEKPKPDVVPQDEAPDLVHHEHRIAPEVYFLKKIVHWSLGSSRCRRSVVRE